MVGRPVVTSYVVVEGFVRCRSLNDFERRTVLGDRSVAKEALRAAGGVLVANPVPFVASSPFGMLPSILTEFL